MKVEKKSLHTEHLVSLLRSHMDSMSDPRSQNNAFYNKTDFLLSAFSIFYLQSPSWLSSQTRMNSTQGKHNLHSLFGSFSIPSDTQIKDFLDLLSPNELNLLFYTLLQELSSSGLLKQFQASSQDYLLIFDGVQYFSSHNISCQNCTKKHYEYKTETLAFDLNPEYLNSLENLTFPLLTKEDQKLFQQKIGKFSKNKLKTLSIECKEKASKWRFSLNERTFIFKKTKEKLSLFEETISYSHSMLTPVFVASHLNEVISLPPEFIKPQDGKEKQDCEIEAGKRWIEKHSSFYEGMKITLGGDDLFSRTPFCNEVLKVGWNFIFVCKPSSHTSLYEKLAELEKTKKGITKVTKNRLKGKKYETEEYRFVNGVTLYETEQLEVNWFEVTITNEKDKITYKNSFVTNKSITKTNVEKLVEEGRAKWKIENENNNTLKTKGYHLEHNFGHGKENLSSILATLNILAFFFHTILALADRKYQILRMTLSTRETFFQHLRTITCYNYFKDWNHLFNFMLESFELENPDTT